MSSQPIFPTFDIEGREFSKLLIGHNPFLGGSYMSKARSRLYQETFGEAEALERILVKASEMGVRGMLASLADGFTERLRAAMFGAAEKTGVLLPTIMIVSKGFEAQFDTYRELNCQVMLVHGQWSDALYVKAENTMQPDFADALKRIRDGGFVPAYSTHNAGEVIPAAEAFDAAMVRSPLKWSRIMSPRHIGNMRRSS